MIPETLRSCRACHIKIAIEHLGQKQVRICIRGWMRKRFNMITKMAQIFTLARVQMRNMADIHHSSKVVGNPQRMPPWSLNLVAWVGNCKLLLLRKPEQWTSLVINPLYYRIHISNIIHHNPKLAVQWVKGSTLFLHQIRKIERVLLKLLSHMVEWTWTFKNMVKNDDWYRSRIKSKFRLRGIPPRTMVDSNVITPEFATKQAPKAKPKTISSKPSNLPQATRTTCWTHLCHRVNKSKQKKDKTEKTTNQTINQKLRNRNNWNQ